MPAAVGGWSPPTAVQPRTVLWCRRHCWGRTERRPTSETCTQQSTTILLTVARWSSQSLGGGYNYDSTSNGRRIASRVSRIEIDCCNRRLSERLILSVWRRQLKCHCGERRGWAPADWGTSGDPRRVRVSFGNLTRNLAHLSVTYCSWKSNATTCLFYLLSSYRPR